MKQLKKEELKEIRGGAFTASLLNAISRAGSLILELGRSVGSSVRRFMTNSLC